MSEEQQEYKADALAEAGYVSEAMELLRGQPAAIIEPSRTVRALQDGGLVDYTVWGWVKTSAKFRAHIKVLRGAKHDIWHYLALGVDETGKCKETIKDICEGTGYSHTEVINTLKELDEMGYLSISKDKKGNTYTPEFVARGDKKPTENVVKKVDSTPVYQVESTQPLEPAPTIPLRVKRENAIDKKGDLVDGVLFYGGLAKERKEDAVEEIIVKLEQGLRVNISRSNANQSVARRILKDGRSIDEWLAWCKSDEWRLAHLYYYADLEKVWRDFPQAFGTTNYNPLGLEIE